MDNNRNRVKRFLKNYKKIIIGALIFLLLVGPVTAGLMIIYSCQSTLASNKEQMDRIMQNAVILENYDDSLTEQINGPYKDNGKLLAAFLADYNEDVYNEELLNAYFEALGTDGVRILNNKREVVYQNKYAPKIDFTDSYYDSLFLFPDADMECLTSDYGNSIVLKTDDEKVAFAFQSGDYIVVEELLRSLESYENDIDRWDLIFHDSRDVNKSFFSVISKDNGNVIYSENNTFVGSTIDIESTEDTLFYKN